MKPIKLQLENIGPFTGITEIDFPLLGDMFLICGDTGAGKTTILDAICYALYGTLPGSHSPNTRTLRSDFAPQDATCSISFEFSLTNARWKVTRQPPAQYTNKNGKISEKPAEVAFYRANENNWQLISGKTTEADAAIASLIGLSADEFSRIVLLPQGDFAEFLHLSSNDRKTALSKLFPVQDYQAITAYATEKSTEYRTQLAAVEERIIQLQETFNAENATQELATLKTEIEQTEQKQRILQNELMEQSVAAEQARQQNAQFAEFARISTEFAVLAEKQPFMDTIAQKLSKAHAAQVTKPSYDVLQNLCSRAQELETHLCASKKTAETLTHTQEELFSKKGTIDELEEKNRQMDITIRELERAAAIEHSLTETKAAFEESLAQKTKVQQEIQAIKDEMKPLASEIADNSSIIHTLESLIATDSAATDQLQKAREEARMLDEYKKFSKNVQDGTEAIARHSQRKQELTAAAQLLQEELATLRKAVTDAEHADMAYALSQTLIENAPCPVCGAVHHPQPAVPANAAAKSSLQEQIRIKEQMLQQTEKDKQENERMLAGMEDRVEQQKKQLSDCGTPDENAKKILADASAAKEKAKKALDDANRAVNRQKEAEAKQKKLSVTLEPLDARLTTLTETCITAETEKHQFEEQLKRLTDGKVGANQTVASVITDFQRIMKQNADVISSYEQQTTQTAQELASVQGELAALKKNKNDTDAEKATAETKLQELLSENGFDSAQEMLTCFLQPSQKNDLEAQKAAWEKDMARLSALKEKLQNELEGKTPPDIAAAEQKLEDTNNAIHAASARINELTSRSSSLADQNRQWQEQQEKRQELSQKSEKYVQLANDLSGKNIKNLSFESWILGVYLEEITIHASKRLERISSGRYTLLLKADKAGRQRYSGLDLEIFDAYTGKKRPCETLSGGETFLVSISLALALTDVVQSKSGGIQLDSLFIDEGFGTLDEVTLEKALSILDEIRGCRTIGLISHVSELKNRIPARIEVCKKTTGSTLKLIHQ